MKYSSVSLAELCTDISYGYTASATDKPIGPKFLRITDIQGGVVNWENVPYCEIDEKNLSKNILEDGDIVIARTGNSTGENYMYQSEVKSVFASYLIRYRVDPLKANPHFVWLNMRAKSWWSFVNGAKTGSAQAGANAQVLGSYKLNLPPRKIQDKAVSIISKLNEKIELNKKINLNLERIAQVIFKSWFVDFDPVYAKKLALEKGLNPAKAERAAMAIISGLCGPTDFAENFEEMDKKLSAKLSKMSKEKQEELAHTASLFPSGFEYSELGEIPTGWKAGEVKDITMVKAGYAFKSKDFQDTGLPVVKIKNIDDSGRVSLNDVQYIPEPIAEKVTRFKLKTGDFLIAMTGAKVGKCGLLTIQGKPAYLNQRVGKFEPHSPKHIGYLYTLFMREESKNYVLTTAQGSAQPNISSDGIERMKTVIPSNDLIDLFSNFSSHVINKITTSELENLRLRELRDTLLPKLLAGEIDLSKIETLEDS